MPRVSSGMSPPHTLRPGLTASQSVVVTDEDTAQALGSGDVPVLATPRLISVCEEASNRAVADHLAPGRTTVATRVQFDHLAPVPVGATVTAEATLVRVHGRRLIFTVSASRRSDTHPALVGAGRVTRVLVDEAAFVAKANALRP